MKTKLTTALLAAAFSLNVPTIASAQNNKTTSTVSKQTPASGHLRSTFHSQSLTSSNDVSRKLAFPIKKL
ncbi:hypothetical protein KUH03_01990 [Sphingobacterium sp. E70]|uniref:hypothetical protein n=1 Tax=Sphingobacterium sp. E70 TaxID=2853439 RepID=UPI00211CFB8B|nr:hypothetical protein [Sphingobacterium sp. E70]ULT29229.1 hypothetical protein KUH03_01990 [Sphingobacterium sp. E70]